MNPPNGTREPVVNFTMHSSVQAEPGTRWKWADGTFSVVIAFGPIAITERVWVENVRGQGCWQQSPDEPRQFIGALAWNHKQNRVIPCIEGELVPYDQFQDAVLEQATQLPPTKKPPTSNSMH